MDSGISADLTAMHKRGAKSFYKVRSHRDVVDASPHAKQKAHAADATGKCINACTVLTTRIKEAEEVAIAMALASTKHIFILSDSQVAIRFAHGHTSQHALRILRQSQQLTCSEDVLYASYEHSTDCWPPVKN